GIKPLYYHVNAHRLVFASELKALMRFPELRTVNPQAAFDYLAYAQVDHDSDTFIEGVHQVPAATVMELDMRLRRPALTATRFWGIDLNRRVSPAPEEAAGEFRRLFLESISLHLRSDVPVGSCLSGGLD